MSAANARARSRLLLHQRVPRKIGCRDVGKRCPPTEILRLCRLRKQASRIAFPSHELVPPHPNRDVTLAHPASSFAARLARAQHLRKSLGKGGGIMPRHQAGLIRQAAVRSRIVPSRSPACPRPPPPPRCSRNFRSVMEARKHPRPGTPPICSVKDGPDKLNSRSKAKLRRHFLQLRPHSSLVGPANTSCSGFPQGPRATLRMLAGASRDSFRGRVSLEKESASHLAIFHELAGTLPVQPRNRYFHSVSPQHDLPRGNAAAASSLAS